MVIAEDVQADTCLDPNVDFQRARSSDQSMELFAGQSGGHRGCPGDVSMAGRLGAARVQFVKSWEWQSAPGIDRCIQE